MGALSIWHILLIAAVALLLLGGRGKISGIMGDTAKGIRAFREGLKGEDEAHEEEPEPAKPLPKATAAKSTAAKGGAKTAARSTAKSKA
ncbi:MAG: twin-arginine translocase TatA/TatE family subunit [Proteobacteria bacterium]|nr:twin-arginine translocase TatA/TatE family subunit [Pseudomonadota bacterium]